MVLSVVLSKYMSSKLIQKKKGTRTFAPAFSDRDISIIAMRLINLKTCSLTLIQHDRNYGLAATRNTGAHYSQGEWMYFLDDDDQVLKDGLLALTERASETD